MKDDQVALLRAEVNTGVILDENLDKAVTDIQVVYTVFDDLKAAVSVANNLIKDGKIECVIYGKNQELVKYLSPTL